jgi:hyaluronan synthase
VDHLLLLCTIISLAVGIARYLIGGIINIAHPDVGIKKDYNYQPTIAVLLPCFNEGQAVYDTIVSIFGSNYPLEKIRVIATDDCSVDDSHEWLEKAARDFPRVTAIRNETNQGKTQTILNALAQATEDVAIIVDSDTMLHPDALKEMMAGLADKRLGAVGGVCQVRNPDDSIVTAFQVYLYYLGFQLGKSIENRSRCVGVIGGYLFALRRELFEEIRPDLEARNWFGVKVKDGEDRFITHNVLLRGHGTYMDIKAICYTTVPNTFVKYFGQQLRWRRTTIRDFFFTLRRIPTHAFDVSVFSLYVYVLTPMVLFLSVAEIMVYFYLGPLAFFDTGRIVLFLAYAFIALILVQLFSPAQRLQNPAKVLAYVGWWLVNSLILVPLALLTLDADGWGNRDKKKMEAHSDRKKSS